MNERAKLRYVVGVTKSVQHNTLVDNSHGQLVPSPRTSLDLSAYEDVFAEFFPAEYRDPDDGASVGVDDASVV